MSRYFEAGVLEYRVLSREGLDSVDLEFDDPDGGTTTGLSTIVGDVSTFPATGAGQGTLRLTDTTVSVTFDDTDPNHCIVSPIDGGWRYSWDDAGSTDHDYNDIVVEIRIPPLTLPPETLSDRSGCDLHVAIYEQDGVTLIAHVPRRRGVRWLDEVNTAGTAQFELHLGDAVLVANPSLLNQYNVVKFALNGTPIKAWLIEDVQPVRVATGEQADEWVTVTGRGVISALEAAVVYPEYGLRELVSEDRNFNFASRDGVWRNPGEWVAGVGVLWPSDTAPARAHHPTNWPDPLAYWIWSSDPLTNAPPGRNWLRSTFTLAATTPVIVYATADNVFQLYLDGELIIASDPSTEWAFRTRFEFRVTLAAGLHTLAAVVDNITNLPSPAGFIATIFRTNASGDPTGTNVFRTKPANTIVKPYGNTPGWFGATIIRQCVIEAQERHVTSLLPVTFGFDNVYDSNGVAWNDIQERTVKLGTTDVWDLSTQVIETTLDLDLDANFVLRAWKERGQDRSATMRILPSRDVTAAAGTIRAGKLRNQALLKFDGGWMELFSAASKDLFGRREVGLSVGTSTSTEQTQLVGTSTLREVARPEHTIPLSYTCVAGPQPYHDFMLGDTLTVPDVFSGLTKARLMSITGSETENVISWDLDFYPHQNNDEIDVIVVANGGAFVDLYEEEVLSDSPWAYWRLTETAAPLLDSSGHLRSLTVTGSPLYAQPGPVDKAMLFSQLVTQYAESSAGSRYKLQYNTLEAWVYVDVLPGANRSNIIGMAVEYDHVTHDKELGLNPDGTLYYYVSQAGVPKFVTSPTALSLNTWYHVVGSVGAQGQKLYINGELVASAPAVKSSYTALGQRVFIRGGGNNFDELDRVIVAEPAVYFQQLLDTRIAAHYRASGV